ncbi:MAG: DUF3880 domain-containing protein [Lachnospiraceae bacterium]|nr:DUF3880 domain-containing protein [Lachnospiraceae bacterium]
MKILFLNWNSFGNEDLTAALKELGHEVLLYPFSKSISFYDTRWEQAFTSFLRSKTPDYVFSFAYFPIVSKACEAEGILYLSWVYDSPHVALYSYTMLNHCNRIFLFDKELCLTFLKAGFQNIYYLPMAVNPSRIGKMLSNQSADIRKQYACDISFVGSLYTEPKHNLYSRLTNISAYTRGYLDGLVQAQMKVYGYNFLEAALTPDIMEDLLHSDYPMLPASDSVETSEYLYAQYVLNRRVTALEREKILSLLGQSHPVDLYTHDTTVSIQGVRNHGPVDYYDAMPYVFHNSKINLNISLRSIHSGIPLRAFDIMGSGGFLLSNYQSDFMDLFALGEDFVYYEAPEQVPSLVQYYLTHEDERSAICQNGYAKVTQNHTYRQRLGEIFSVL